MQAARFRNRFRSRPFNEARCYVRSLGLSTARAYWKWAKTAARPQDIPARPEAAYARQGWAGYGDWLGTGIATGRTRSFLTYDEASRVVREAGIPSSAEYHVWSRPPPADGQGQQGRQHRACGARRSTGRPHDATAQD